MRDLQVLPDGRYTFMGFFGLSSTVGTGRALRNSTVNGVVVEVNFKGRRFCRPKGNDASSSSGPAPPDAKAGNISNPDRSQSI